MGAIVIISIFMLIAVFLVAFIVGLSSKGEAKEAEKEEAKEEKLKELQGWYTAEMREDYEKAVANAAKEAKEEEARLKSKLESGAGEVVVFEKELNEVWKILNHAKTTEKISKTEHKIRANKALEDLEQKYPNAIYFAKSYHDVYGYANAEMAKAIVATRHDRLPGACRDLLSLYDNIKSLI